MNNDARSAQYRECVQEFLKQWYEQFHGEPQKALYEAMEYSLLAGGKRLRPIFTLEFCRLCCGDWKKAVPFAAAVEMIHTYSLIHDDLPCMDNDDFRRGRPTNHKVYGEAMAVLAGDALLTDAFAVASTADVDPEPKVSAMQLLSECAGSLGMVGGQALDVMSEQRQLTEEEILDIHMKKTGLLITAACTIGAVAGGANEAQFALQNGASFTLVQKTDYPWDGAILFDIRDRTGGTFDLKLRIPGWAKSGYILAGGQKLALTQADAGSYVTVTVDEKISSVFLSLDMPAYLVRAHTMVEECDGQAAVMRGPIVYCLEQADAPCDADEVYLPYDAVSSLWTAHPHPEA